jgi:hypothetical protein
MAIHMLKTSNGVFQEVWDKRKLYEIRFNDRDYGVGDILVLREHSVTAGKYCGRWVVLNVIHMTTHESRAISDELNVNGIQGLGDGWVVLGCEFSERGFNKENGAGLPYHHAAG